MFSWVNTKDIGVGPEDNILYSSVGSLKEYLSQFPDDYIVIFYAEDWSGGYGMYINEVVGTRETKTYGEQKHLKLVDTFWG